MLPPYIAIISRKIIDHVLFLQKTECFVFSQQMQYVVTITGESYSSRIEINGTRGGSCVIPTCSVTFSLPEPLSNQKYLIHLLSINSIGMSNTTSFTFEVSKGELLLLWPKK